MTDKTASRLHVLVVDDSAVVRQVMQAILTTDDRIRVSTASDPVIAFTKMEKEHFDVILTDLEMPRMDGLTFLRKVMAQAPVPVIVCSGFAASGTELAMRALEDGAVEVIAKPKLGVREFLHESAVVLLDAVWAASKARVRPRSALIASPRYSADYVLPGKPRALSANQASKTSANPSGKLSANRSTKLSANQLASTSGKLSGKTSSETSGEPSSKASAMQPAVASERLIAVGASTGGTEALRVFLGALPPDCPGVVVVQHMPEVFTRAFANRLNSECAIEVKEAENGDRVLAGRALIAPGNYHLVVNRVRGHYQVEVREGPLVSRHRPSVDVLFRSVANCAGKNAVGIMMTGMGDDGAAGMLEMKEAGACNIAQDEATSVVFGMPREAIERGAVDHILPLERIATRALSLSAASTEHLAAANR